MEECEALCSRIAIMVNGKFRCLGSTQHLRSKYGQGYSVAIRLKREHESDTVYFTEIQVAMGRVLPSAVLKDCHQCLLHYHITDTAQTWSNIFTQMNALNETFHFEDYFVSDTTLEVSHFAFWFGLLMITSFLLLGNFHHVCPSPANSSRLSAPITHLHTPTPAHVNSHSFTPSQHTLICSYHTRFAFLHFRSPPPLPLLLIVILLHLL